MEPTSKLPIRRFEDGRAAAASDAVVTEMRIELEVNDGELRLAMLCLPRDLEALAVGFLTAEGALRRAADLQTVEFLASDSKVVVRGDLDADALEAISLRWTRGTGCGGGGTGRDVHAPALPSVGAGPTVSPERLGQLARQFDSRTDLWRKTGGVHACGLSDGQTVLLFAEDVGRHNAFDKVVGLAALKGIDLSDKIVLTTGRLSAEIVAKAVSCRIPILVSRSAVTSLAVQMAARADLTLAGFLRGRRMNVYTGYHRIVQQPAE